MENTNYSIPWEPRSTWNDAAYPPENTGKMGSWGESDVIWIRVKALEVNGIVRRAAYTALGRCLFPLKAGPCIPVPKKNPDAVVSNPATTQTWLHDDPYYAVNGAKVDASHWLPCPEPIPPGEIVPMVVSGASNVAVFQQ